MTIKTAGIILKVIRYNDTHEIHTLFTQELGLVSLMSKIKKRELLPPLFEGEFTLQKRKNFFNLVDAKQIVSHHEIRNTLESIETAFKLIHYILKSQMAYKPAPALFALLSAFLKVLPHMENKKGLLAVFLAKILLHEGHLNHEEELLATFALIKSFQEIESLTITDEQLKSIDETFDETYEFVPEKERKN